MYTTIVLIRCLYIRCSLIPSISIFRSNNTKIRSTCTFIVLRAIKRYLIYPPLNCPNNLNEV